MWPLAPTATTPGRLLIAAPLVQMSPAMRLLWTLVTSGVAGQVHSARAMYGNTGSTGLGPHERIPVGVSVPELVDLDGLVATDAVVPGLTGDLREWAEIGVECVESDVRAAAHAEASVGAGQGFPSFGYL
jgi:hypothetical protein